MSWQHWGKANFKSLVNQGIEQVNKLREDVEKQLDEAVGNRGVNEVLIQNNIQSIKIESVIPFIPTSGSQIKSPQPIQKQDSNNKSKKLETMLQNNIRKDMNNDEVQQSAERDLKSAFDVDHQGNEKNTKENDEFVPNILVEEKKIATSESLHSSDALEQICSATEKSDVNRENVLTAEAVIPDKESELVFLSNNCILPVIEMDDDLDKPVQETKMNETNEDDEQAVSIKNCYDQILNNVHQASLEEPLTEKMNKEICRECKTLMDTLRNKEVSMEEERNKYTKKINDIQTLLIEKESKFKDVLKEGQDLSVKQAKYEQRLRKLRSDLEKETILNKENTIKTEKLISEKLELQKINQVFQEDLKEKKKILSLNETENKKAMINIEEYKKTIIILQDTIKNLEIKENHVQDQILQAENDLSELSSAKEKILWLEKENSFLQNSNSILKNSLNFLESELKVQENKTQNAIKSYMKKWQDEVLRVEELTRTAANTAGPFLRQIDVLHQELRNKNDAFVETERKLQDLVKKEEDMKYQIGLKLDKEILDGQKKQDTIQRLEKEVHELELKHIDLKEKYRNCRQMYENTKCMCNDLGSEKKLLNETIKELEKNNRHLQSIIQERVECSTGKDKANTAEQDELRDQIRNLKQLLNKYEEDALTKNIDTSQRKSSLDAIQTNLGNPNVVDFGSSSNDGLNDQNTNIKSYLLETEILRQYLKRKDGEVAALKYQNQVLETVKKELSEEMYNLKMKTIDLREFEHKTKTDQAKIVELEKKQEVLLELLGEKDELLEYVQSEFSDFKDLYHRQIDSLTKDPNHT